MHVHGLSSHILIDNELNEFGESWASVKPKITDLILPVFADNLLFDLELKKVLSFWLSICFTSVFIYPIYAEGVTILSTY